MKQNTNRLYKFNNNILNDQMLLLLNNCPTLVSDAEGFAKDFFKLLAENARLWHKEEHTVKKNFNKKLELLWLNSFDFLNLLTRVLFECHLIFESKHKGETINRNKFWTANKINSRIIQVAEETICLLENGYPNGAMSRWRVLHELQVVLSFLAQEDDNVLFLMYEQHAILKVYQAETAARAAGHKYYTNEAYKGYEDAVEIIKQKYDFKKFNRDYGWAYLKLNNTKFSEIESSIKETSLKRNYDKACAMSHSDARATFENIGLIDNTEMFLAGATDMGLSEPAQLTMITLLKAICAYNGIFKTDEVTIMIIFLSTMLEAMLKETAEIQGNIETRSGKTIKEKDDRE